MGQRSPDGLALDLFEDASSSKILTELHSDLTIKHMSALCIERL